MGTIFGIHAVREAIKARGRAFEWVGVSNARHDARLAQLVEQCRTAAIAVRFLSREELDRLAGDNRHQGVVAVTSTKQYADLEEVIAARRSEHALIVVLDGIEDPHNLGAILRTAEASGANGVVIPERRAAGVTATVARISAGASEHLPVSKVTNLGRTLEELKRRGFWIVGLDERGRQSYTTVDYRMDCAFVFGAEGKGLHELVSKKCDFLVSVPMLGQVSSLNVSVTAGVVLFEAVRQRQKQAV